MKTVDIKGKAYVEVNERLKHFREHYPDHALITEMLSNADGVCIFRATIFDETDRAIATGHAYEKEGSTFINKTSYIENCETSAWGRALGNFGIGIDTAVATADEVQNAIKNQDTLTESVPVNEKQLNEIVDMLTHTESDEAKFLKYLNAESLETIPASKYKMAISALQKKADKAA